MSFFNLFKKQPLVKEKNINISEYYQQGSSSKVGWTACLLGIIVVNAAIWSLTLTYLNKAKRTYVSDWSITIPGVASNTNINLPEIGQATSQNYSAYAASSYDPRENYKLLASSDDVIRAAATSLNLPLENFGQAKIKIIPNTTIMKFELSGSTPNEAQNKSQALYQAFENRINKLRDEEVVQQNLKLQVAIQDLRLKLRSAQQNLSTYKTRSGLSTNEQISTFAVNIEALRRQKAELLAQERQYNSRLVQLSTNLDISPQNVARAFALQSDPVFQKYLQNYSEVRANLTNLKAKFLPTHP
ncbi:MAG: hypothetical protein HC908_06770 [Calothrix sp. SM1_7_51]|nr:hypothetical protein [Calothrix sp. SM1_7_51]